MAERIFRKKTIFGNSEIFIDDRTKMTDYIEELKLKGYEEVAR